MSRFPARIKSLITSNLPLFMLVFLLIYTFALLVLVPYAGFYFSASNGIISRIYVTPVAAENALYPGDQILQIGGMSLETYQQDLYQVPFQGFHTGETIPITVLRDNQKITVDWRMPGFNLGDFGERIIELWWLAYVFWFFGTLTWLSVRPRDQRWKLLIAFDYLTAAWLMCGQLSSTHMLGSVHLFRSLLWLTIPVYLHLHWVFPRPLARIPRGLVWAGYLLGFSLAVLQWVGLLENRSPYIALLMAAYGSLALLATHAILQPDQRRNLWLMGFFAMLAILPVVLINISATFSDFAWFLDLSFVSLCLLPASYTYVLFRGQVGDIRGYANRALIAFTYGTILLITGILLGPLTQVILTEPERMPGGVLIFVVTSILAVLAYPPYSRWAERYLLGIPLPPAQLLEIYPERITTCLDEESLVRLLRNEVLPSLLIRQSTLLHLDENGATRHLYVDLPPEFGLPQDCLDPTILDQSGAYLPAIPGEANPTGYDWIRLVLPLTFGDRAIGVWLFGKRDPDDLYRSTEISILQALANQTAVALINILQTKRLHALYRMNIERQEDERKYLALELHDGVLGQMALLRMNLQQYGNSDLFEQAYQTAVGHIRDIINGLRPVMLNFGLASAIAELPETFLDLPSETKIAVDLAASEQRYTPEVELHLYRIVQQAMQNALMHAKASQICIRGDLKPDKVLLVVEDNGIGYHDSRPLNLVSLLSKGHFGLAGMHERAALIGAQIQITTPDSRGTRLQVTWEAHTPGG